VSTSVFLGLVTYEGSRFADSSGPDGLVPTVARCLDEHGLRTTVRVNARDAYSPSLLQLTRAEVVHSIDAELDVEGRWRAYVSPPRSPLAMRAFMAARRARRRIAYAPPWRGDLGVDDPGPRMLRRLVNIELSHIDLMQAAVESGSEWALIVEDDAYAADASAFARALAEFVQAREGEHQPRYMNVSRSFAEDRLGIAQHLTEIGVWGSGPVKTMSSSRPVTNTVCAILYRTGFLNDLLDMFDSIPLSPVLPIDWKLNAAILAMVGQSRLGSGDCWFLSPAPVEQRSMA
jgi:hypothetical protein